MSKLAPDYDVVIIGAGPTGLAAAVYTGREALKTLIMEKAVVGGMAAVTEIIENYPGFADGIGGLELSDNLKKQATKFGAELKTFAEVTALSRDGEIIKLTSAGTDVTAGAVLIATGSIYRQLGVPGEAEHIGRGVHYCATCDGPLYRGKELIVVGGGNSAMQELLFLVKYASHITLLVRGAELSGSAILRERATKLANVTIHYNTVVDQICVDAAGKVTGVGAKEGGKGMTFHAPGVFVFIGLLANTAAFTSLELDHQHFVKTGLHYDTSLEGVYAAGDVRSGSTWQIASAVGEGASAALEIRSYLDLAHHEGHFLPAKT
jgi:thioredoxin reductase (NADPH)